MHVPLSLRTHGAQLKPHRPVLHTAPQLPQTPHPDILQAVLQAGQQVGHEARHGPAVQHAPRHALGDQEAVALAEVPRRARVGRGRFGRRLGHGAARLLVFHRVDAAHAPVRFDQLPFVADEVAPGRFGRAGQQPAHHHRRRAQSEALDDVAHVLDPAVGDAGDPEPRREARHVEDGCRLRSTDGHDFLRDASRAGPHADPEPVRAGGDQGGGLRNGHDVSSNHVQIRVLLFDVFDHFDLKDGVALRGVEDDNVETSVRELLESILVFWPRADRGGADELLRMRKLGGERVV